MRWIIGKIKGNASKETIGKPIAIRADQISSFILQGSDFVNVMIGSKSIDIEKVGLFSGDEMDLLSTLEEELLGA